ncbi:1-phosphatidylinositol-3-phosphate 5-kinase FAB1B [Elaeis guineensis]|uniref:1-phosphatidylinositol-3-phosphate 5-kinase n=2 Tax=Elaeis guineensis var. tenera TaxID=51953 RepID=A0A6J0PQL0_ELAGV|nr:1-phosphatidylinositol-3-phosphate 5-kinase FAB1B isoform X1 [Elaeis guineensis]XP_019710075.1 1-phosphatidylinositol-3-phosphate 5-kinase FAB1B isoform X1 [Elaeis guineensis]
METSDKAFSEIVGILRSLIPRRSEPANVSRDFWMPDHSCRVCYECDSQFTIFNRRHHCRLCGRIFCGRCTANSVPVLSDDPKSRREGGERIRVCNFCFKQWEQEVAVADNGVQAYGPIISPSLSTTSLVSTKSSGTVNSTATTICSYSTGPYQHVPYGSGPSPGHSANVETFADNQDSLIYGRGMDIRDPSPPSQLSYSMNRSGDSDDVYGLCPSNLEAQSFQHSDDFYGQVEFDEVDQDFHSNELHPAGENIDAKEICSPLHDNTEFHAGLDVDKMEEEAEPDNSYECDAASIYGMENADAEPVDFENNGLLWLPPDPEDEEDDKEAVLYDDDDEDASGEWGYLRSSNSFSSGEYRSRDRSSEEHKKAMKNVVDGHFRALISQLLQVENLPVGEENDKGSWLEIITSLSWEAATFLKPDTSKGGGMDPGGYVKVKCLACGNRSESMVVKGVVCKKNVAHRRMTSKIEKPRFLILGGALEYQRVTNLLSSFDTLLQQEMDHLKMAVAKIGAHHPNVLLVEKSVSRFAQDYLLAKNISLVLNIKRPLLERMARCTGAQIVPSIDHLSSQKLGYCDLFHVEKFVEEHGGAGQGGKKMMKTLMFFEGCPKPLGCTILLKGANTDELKKVKHVVQYGVFAAYHLALETSFLADEGASLPELPLKSPITVALPDKPSSIDRSISIIPGFTASAAGKPQLGSDAQRPHTSDPSLELLNSEKMVKVASLYSSESTNPQMADSASSCSLLSIDTQGFSVENNQAEQVVEPTSRPSVSSLSTSGVVSNFSPGHDAMKEKNKVCFGECDNAETFGPDDPAIEHDSVVPGSCNDSLETSERSGVMADTEIKSSNMVEKQAGSFSLATLCQDIDQRPDNTSIKEEFPPSPSDHQSILVSLSTRCVWKGTVCERSHLFRIKYYGNFDKPLGRYLRDHLFDQSYRCHSCDMPSEAHVHCYTHHQGSLTISVRKLPEILLKGERDGKIWMWHRCLRCPRNSGFPPATRRVVMSDAAWGLSLGKFLELSFSNHAAASRVASCGHSLHRDCLRFYGFGKMVACFRYASIDVHSVYLPPPKLDFNYMHQEWIQKEANEVADGAELLFNEILNALHQIAEKKLINGSMKVPELRHHIVELEGILEKEKAEFEDCLHRVLKKEARKGQPVFDILEVNKLKRQLIFYSYLWDQMLIFAAGSDNDEVLNSFIMRDKEKLTDLNLGLKPQKDFNSSETSPGNFTNNEFLHGSTNAVNHQEDINDHHTHYSSHQKRCIEVDSFQGKQIKTLRSTSTGASEQSVLLETGLIGRRTLSDGQFPVMLNLSDTFDAKWTGENGPFLFDSSLLDPSNSFEAAGAASVSKDSDERSGAEITQSLASALLTKLGDSAEDFSIWIRMPFLNFYRPFNRNLGSTPRFNALNEYNSVYVPLFRELECQGGARFLLPVGVNDTVIPIYDDEPTSIISYALVSLEYHIQISDEWERTRDGAETSPLLPPYDAGNLHLSRSFDETTSDPYKSFGSVDDGILSLSGSRGSVVLDPLIYTKGMHVKVSFADEGPLGKVKYTVTCYYAKHFDALRRTCCPSEFDFIRSLSRCKKWGAQGGKSNVFFAKSLDDRFIIKQVTKTELESFIKFAPEYFKYLSESIGTRSPTCLAKILGIYQVTSRNLKGGKELRMDVLVMENLLFGRNLTRLYDLKGSSRSRYNPDSSGNNKVLLDQNLIESMPTSPIFVGNKAKRLLERAVWNDTSFLASIDVMDYSLLVGVDEEKHELVLGIIDFMRQYTWDKHLETWVKASGILGGPKNVSPTVVSPKQYKKRFRKAMSAYFLVVPDQWSPPTIVPNNSQTDACQDNQEDG